MKREVWCSADSLNLPCKEGLCAERRVLEALRHQANVAGFYGVSATRWVGRRVSVLVVERHTKDGAPACCLPCLLCRRALDSYGVRWSAFLVNGEVVTERDAPRSILTHRQANIFKGTF